MGLRCTLWSSDKGDIPANLAFTNNFNATTDPGSTNDISQGYRRGSQWINTSTGVIWECIVDTTGAATWVVISADSTTPGQITAPAASTATGTGGLAALTGGAGGSTSGAGGQAKITGGAGSAGNANGGDVTIAGGAANGSGVAGVVRVSGVEIVSQGAQATQDTAVTLTAAQLLAGILTSNPAGAVNLQLPLASAMDTALPTSAAGDAFDFSVISLAGSTNLPTLTTNTGWTLVGAMTFTAVAGNAGRFRARKTGTAAWTIYRIS